MLGGRSSLDHLVGRRVEHLHVADRADRRAIARAHAGRVHHAHVRPELARQFGEQLFRTRHRARKQIADPHRDRRWRRLAFLHHVEVRVERRDFVDLGHRQLHFGGKRRHVRSGDVAVFVLDQMQMLDQQITLPRPLAKQCAHLIERLDDRSAGPWACGAACACAARRRFHPAATLWMFIIVSKGHN